MEYLQIPKTRHRQKNINIGKFHSLLTSLDVWLTPTHPPLANIWIRICFQANAKKVVPRNRIVHQQIVLLFHLSPADIIGISPLSIYTWLGRLKRASWGNIPEVEHPYCHSRGYGKHVCGQVSLANRILTFHVHPASGIAAEKDHPSADFEGAHY